uniref:Uncharacterized protein n=1 Tax=Firmicutes phage HS16 TaxID=3056394 RepID=A0AA49X4Q7_9VIRU|nr:MAG: hypothetical protein [Firmicutes phage HS16]
MYPVSSSTVSNKSRIQSLLSFNIIASLSKVIIANKEGE